MTGAELDFLGSVPQLSLLHECMMYDTLVGYLWPRFLVSQVLASSSQRGKREMGCFILFIRHVTSWNCNNAFPSVHLRHILAGPGM